MTEIYPGADQDEKDGYIHDTVPAQRSVPSNQSTLPADLRAHADLVDLRGWRSSASMLRRGADELDGLWDGYVTRGFEIDRLRAALRTIASRDVADAADVAHRALQGETNAMTANTRPLLARLRDRPPGERLYHEAADEIERLTRELRLAIGARDYANDMLDKARGASETGLNP